MVKDHSTVIALSSSPEEEPLNFERGNKQTTTLPLNPFSIELEDEKELLKPPFWMSSRKRLDDKDMYAIPLDESVFNIDDIVITGENISDGQSSKTFKLAYNDKNRIRTHSETKAHVDNDEKTRAFKLKNDKVPKYKNESILEMLLIINSSWAKSTEIGQLFIEKLQTEKIFFILTDQLKFELLDYSLFLTRLKAILNLDVSDENWVSLWCPLHCPIQLFRSLTLSLDESMDDSDSITLKIVNRHENSNLTDHLNERNMAATYIPADYTFCFINNEEFITAVKKGTHLDYMDSLLKRSFVHLRRNSESSQKYTGSFIFIDLMNQIRGDYKKWYKDTCNLAIETTRPFNTSHQAPVDNSKIHQILVQLQLTYPDCWIDLFKNSSLFADWLVEFIKTVSILPYKKRSVSTAYCSLIQQSKGATPLDTFKKMLCEIDHVSEAIADCIVQVYPTLNALIAAFRAAPNAVAGEKLLADLQVNRLKTVKRLGDTISKKIHDSFMSMDPLRRICSS